MDNQQTKPRAAVTEEFERTINALHHAIITGMFQDVRTIISNACTTINIPQLLAYPNEDYWMCTALELAVRHHHKAGCDCPVRMRAGLPPCEDATKFPDKDLIVEFLLENRADPLARNADGLTAMQYAVEPGLYFSNPAPETAKTISRFLNHRPLPMRRRQFKTR